MKHNDASTRAASRRCSPTAWRSAFSAALTLVLLVSCGSTAGSGGTAGGGTVGGGAVSPTSSSPVAFTEVTATTQARNDSGPTLVIGTNDASRATLTRLIPSATAPDGRVLVAAFQGQQNTGGFAIRITQVERRGDQLVVRATFGSPGPGAIVTQAFTSPAHVVSIAAADATGLREAILIDGSGAQRARINTT